MKAVKYEFVGDAQAYRVGDDGSVWTRKNARWGLREEWRMLKLSQTKSGHYSVGLMLGGAKGRSRLVHQLVAEAFIGPRKDGMEVCHNNGVASDNRVENLRWDTRKSNVNDMVKHGVMPCGEKSSNAVLTRESVLAIREEHESGSIGYKKLARKYGVKFSTIVSAVHRKSWKHI